MKKKRIAFVVNGLYGGGAEKVLQTILQHIDKTKYDITVVNHRDEPVNELYPTDIRYKSILKNRSKAGRFWVRLYNKINLIVYENFSPRIFRNLYFREKFDVEIAFIEGYATRIVSGGRSGRKIAWVHIDLKSYPWTDIAFRSKKEQVGCYAHFDDVICVSESVKEAFDGLFPSNRSSVMYNPMDNAAIRSLSTRFVPEGERESRPLLFVSVGRLVDQKGYDRLIPIVGRLIAEGFDFRLWIVGEGPQREHLESLIRQWKLEEVVTLQGYHDNPYPFVSAADWFVCSSRHEGYSLVVVEALMLGIPVISVMCAVMNKLLGDHNEWGIITENDDLALLNGMRNVLTDPEVTLKYRTRAAQRGNDFSLERQMNEFYKIIDRE